MDVLIDSTSTTMMVMDGDDEGGVRLTSSHVDGIYEMK